MASKRSKPVSIVLVAVAFMLVLILAGELCGGEPQRVRGSGDHICEKASYVRLCKAVVKRLKSPYEATRVTVKQLIMETEAARKALAEKKKGGIPDQLITVCEMHYDNALSKVQEGLSSMRPSSKGGLNICLSVATTNYYMCDEAFTMKNTPSPLAKTNARLRHIASNALFLASLWP